MCVYVCVCMYVHVYVHLYMYVYVCTAERLIHIWVNVYKNHLNPPGSDENKSMNSIIKCPFYIISGKHNFVHNYHTVFCHNFRHSTYFFKVEFAL